MASRRIEDLYQPIQELVRKLLVECNKVTSPWQTFITDGYRTIAEQNELYAQGRTKPGNIVTNAKGGESIHNYGLAIDLAFQKDGQLSYDVNLYKKIAPIAKSMGFAWGGDWASFPDKPHFEYTQGLTIAQLKAGKRPTVGSIIDPMLNTQERRDAIKAMWKLATGQDTVPEAEYTYWVGAIPNPADLIKIANDWNVTIVKRAYDAKPPQIVEVEKIVEKPVEVIKEVKVEVPKIEIKEVPVPETELGAGRLFELLINKLFSRS